MNRCFLVTGAAGFIGSKVAAELIKNGNTVVTVDNLSTGKKENIPQGCIFLQGNVYDDAVLKNLKQYSFETIIHIAGQSSGEISFDDPVYDLQTNTQSTLMLLNYARKNGCKRFLYASSMSVYGDHVDPFVNEESETTPKSFYAVGKLASENYMRIFSAFGIQCTALRFFNVYGIGQNMDNLRQGMASIFLTMALRNQHIQVKGSKDRFRDFVYIDDVVDAVLKAAERTKGEYFEVYNVSTGIPCTVEKVVASIQNALPFDISVEYIAGTPGDQFGIYGNYEKIKRDLDWSPKTNFETGIEKMVQWAQSL